MNPRNRPSWTEMFQELRAIVDFHATAVSAAPRYVCDDCGGRLFMIFGRHSGKYFFSHEGISECSNIRAIPFETREAAEKATEVFQ